ncbi:hypothetical protein AVEN_224618-1 [Araneus ventricosus]|uniref:RING-type domain-containing protein n=1 Tax=Araneus ventricosus TaxID=182803 RepID=A0A4Y2QQX3_ARAVE|nr:hypothetical protein AVEN_224618-1 [Araneus ventricosus]
METQSDSSPFSFDDSYFATNDLSPCPICLETLGRDSYETVCQHTFHRNCFKVLLKSGCFRCPCCREQISGDDGLSARNCCDFCARFSMRNVCSLCRDSFRYVVEIGTSIRLSKTIHFVFEDGSGLSPKQIECLKLFLLRYATVLTACKTYIETTRFDDTSAIFYLKTLLQTLNLRDDHFDVERAMHISDNLQNFLNDHAENGGRIIRADRDYIKFFDRFGDMIAEFYKSPFKTTSGTFLANELTDLRRSLRDFEKNTIRRALWRFVGTIDRCILEHREHVDKLYSYVRLRAWGYERVKMSRLNRKVNRVWEEYEHLKAEETVRPRLKKLYFHF